MLKLAITCSIAEVLINIMGNYVTEMDAALNAVFALKSSVKVNKVDKLFSFY